MDKSRTAHIIKVKHCKPPRGAMIDRQYFRAINSIALYTVEVGPDKKPTWYICSQDGEPCHVVKKTLMIIQYGD